MSYIDITIKNLHNICFDCENSGTTKCVRAKCNVGFAFNLTELMQENKKLIVEDGLKLIPRADTKYYDARMIARCIAAICKLCKGCNTNHTELCAISLARKSIEGVILKESLDFPGNVLTYFVNVSEQNADFANLIMEEFKRLD